MIAQRLSHGAAEAMQSVGEFGLAAAEQIGAFGGDQFARAAIESRRVRFVVERPAIDAEKRQLSIEPQSPVARQRAADAQVAAQPIAHHRDQRVEFSVDGDFRRQREPIPFNASSNRGVQERRASRSFMTCARSTSPVHSFMNVFLNSIAGAQT